jgi:hypothetical protein
MVCELEAAAERKEGTAHILFIAGDKNIHG